MFDQFLSGVPTPLKFILAFAIVILLIVLAAWLIRRLGGQKIGASPTGRSRQPRLGVLDVLAVDGRRRLVIVRRDNVEHLVMIGGPNDVVIESGILRLPAGAQGQRDAPPLAAPAGEPTARTVPPQPVPAPAASAPRAAPQVSAPAQPAPQLRPVEPQRAAVQRQVEAPPIVPARGDPPAIPKAAEPELKPAAPPAAPAPAPARPADPVRPALPVRQAPIIAGPAAPRVADTGPVRNSEIADRLAAALKRPVKPAAPDAVAAALTPAVAAPAPAPEIPSVKTPEPAAAAAEPTPAPAAAAPPPPPPAAKAPEPAVAKPAPELPREMAAMVADAKTAPASSTPPVAVDKPAVAPAPDVRPEPRAAPAEPASKAPVDDDPFASLEAEMANLLGRDVGRPKG